MPVDVRVCLGVPVPLFPGIPMAPVGILVPSMFVMRIVPVLLVGAFPVPMIFVKVAVMRGSVVMPHFIVVAMMFGTLVTFSMVVVVFRFVLSSISMAVVVNRFALDALFNVMLPFIAGKGHTGTAKDDKDDNAEDVRCFHRLSPIVPKIEDIICQRFQ